MEPWLERTVGLSLAELGVLLTVAGLVVAVVTLAHQVRQGGTEGKKRDRGARRRRGTPEQRYTAWFLDAYRTYYNPYLNRTERLELNRSYISLSFQDSPADRDSRAEAQTRMVAEEALGRRDILRAVVVGEPGSGKSTLLKAYGVKAVEPVPGRLWPGLRPGSRGGAPAPELPIFVSLRTFARRRGERPRLAGHVLADVLGAEAGLTQDEAHDLLLRLLEQRRVVLLLDGLDEVSHDHYEEVRGEIYRFAQDHTPEMPTANARLVLTCRRHNFLRIREDWTPRFTQRVYTLAPLRDSEIVTYLHKLRDMFTSPDEGPARFMAEVRASRTLDLHRTPLVLAMSVGLFAPQETFDIPHSIAKLYGQMIEEMLKRHSFRQDQTPIGPNRFEPEDKHRFLREFALAAASELRTHAGVDPGSGDTTEKYRGTINGRPIGFDEFSRDDLVEYARTLVPNLRRVRPTDAENFVDEILDRSGLLKDTSDGAFVFAHKSIQEHLVADELVQQGQPGSRALLDRADDEDWRQVHVFFAAAAHQRVVTPFLRDLAIRNVVLAGACLAGADGTDDVALSILKRLVQRLRAREDLLPTLGALVSATGSPRPAVSEAAVAGVHSVLGELIDNPSAVATLAGDLDGLLRVLEVLASAGTAEIAALVPRLAEAIPDDPRLVEPLWRCLAAPSILTAAGNEGEHATATAIVSRLLGLAMDPDSFASLQRQEPISRGFLTENLRWRAYPFHKGYSQDSAIVTLLALAEHLRISPATPNRYFEAKDAGRLARVERDRYLTIEVSLFRAARIGSAAGFAIAFVVAAAVLIQDWTMLYRPYGWWSIAIYLGPTAVEFAAFIALIIWAEAQDASSWARRNLSGGNRSASNKNENGGLFWFRWTDPTDQLRPWAGLGFLVLGPAAYAFAFAPVIAVSLPGYLVLATMVPFLLHWAPTYDMFNKGRRAHLYQPNVYVDMYDEPRSQHWLVPGAATTITPGSALDRVQPGV